MSRQLLLEKGGLERSLQLHRVWHLLASASHTVKHGVGNARNQAGTG